MRNRTISLVVLFLLMQGASHAQSQGWKPITPADLKSGPVVDTKADAEALFWDVAVEMGVSKTVFSHYIRIKIFTDSGAENQGRVDLPYGGKNTVKDISGRTIQADGTITNLGADSIFDRTIVKAKKVKVQAKSFALPGVKPGAIIEYRWTEVLQGAFHVPLQVQRTIPVQKAQYSIKPISDMPYSVRVSGFNCLPDLKADPRNQKVTVATVTNVPAFREEPYMPPADVVQSWMLAFYDLPGYWGDVSSMYYERDKTRLKVTDEVSRTAKSLVASVNTPEEKIARLYEFCRTEIRRVDDDADAPEVSTATRQNKTPADTLRQKAGAARDIDYLFAALADSAGFESHVAELASREETFFNPQVPRPGMLNSYNIAVKVGDKWKFYDPAGKYLPIGMLRWQEEGVHALLTWGGMPTTGNYVNGGSFALTPISTAERSLIKRNATLRLEADGTVEGDIRIVYFGHPGADGKEALDGLTPIAREEYLQDAVKSRFGGAEVSKVEVQNVTSATDPLIETYHVRIPGYAQRTGKRLFFEPAFFQHGLDAWFTSNTRTYPIYFHYARIEDDAVSIELPQGFDLDESSDQPETLFKSPLDVTHETHIGITKDGRSLQYTRRFALGAANPRTLFPASDYPILKETFDTVYKRDKHTLALRETAPNGGRK